VFHVERTIAIAEVYGGLAHQRLNSGERRHAGKSATTSDDRMLCVIHPGCCVATRAVETPADAKPFLSGRDSYGSPLF
jgi:hypothetical protein